MGNGAANDWLCDEDYLKRESQRVRKNVFKKLKHKLGFSDSKALAEWWINQLKLQNFACQYCKTPIRLIQKLIESNALRGRRTRGEGIRGPFLELERVDTESNAYSQSNCVLICYYCNNDKSHVYTSTEYIRFLAPAKNRHFLHLLEKLTLAESRKAQSVR